MTDKRVPTIRKVGGGSLGVSLHPIFLKTAGFEYGDEIVVDAKKGVITIKKV